MANNEPNPPIDLAIRPIIDHDDPPNNPDHDHVERLPDHPEYHDPWYYRYGKFFPLERTKVIKIGSHPIDLNLIKRRVEDFYSTRMTPVAFFRLDEEVVIDDFYAEALKKTVEKKVVEALIRIEPPAQELKRYGIDVTQNCIGIIPRSSAEANGYTPKIGDRFEFAKDSIVRQFRIDSVKPIDYWVNTEYNLFWLLTAEGAEDKGVVMLQESEHM